MFAVGHICIARPPSHTQTWHWTAVELSGGGWAIFQPTWRSPQLPFLHCGLNGMLLSCVLNLGGQLLHSVCFHGSFLFQSWHAVWCCLLPTPGNNIFSDSLFVNEWKVCFFTSGRERTAVCNTHVVRSIFKKTENRFLIEDERTFSMASMTSKFCFTLMTKTVQNFCLFFFFLINSSACEILLSSMLIKKKYDYVGGLK